MIKGAIIEVSTDGVKFVTIEYDGDAGASAMLVIIGNDSDPVAALAAECDKMRSKIRALETQANIIEAGYNYLRMLPTEHINPKCYWCDSETGLRRVTWGRRYRCATCEAIQAVKKT